MSSKVSCSLLMIVGFGLGLGSIGCSSSDSGGGGDDAGGVVGDDTPPFTNGVSTLSGAADPGYVDGARGTARFANPVNCAYGPDGMLYVADFDNNKLRVVNVETGETSTVITKTGFARPFGLAFAADGQLYVSTDNDPNGGHTDMTGTIWKVDVNAKTATVIVAGIGRPRGIAVMADGRIAVADHVHHVVEVVDPNSGTVTTIAGTWNAKGMVDGLGAAARFAQPYSLAVRGDGMLIVTDYENHRLRIVSIDGTVATLAGVGTAGFADGAMGDAKFNHPQGIVIDRAGDVFITDLENFRVRRIHGGTVETVAGNGTAGFADSDDRLAAQLYGLEGMSAKPDGSMLFLADGGRGEAVPYNRIRIVKMD